MGASESARYAENRGEKFGETRVVVWVPRSRVTDLRNCAAWLRREERLAGGLELERERMPLKLPTYPLGDGPPGQHVLLEADQDDRLLHEVLKANGGRWLRGRERWLVRVEVAEALHLRGQIVSNEEMADLEHPRVVPEK